MEKGLFYELLSGSEYFTLEDLRYNKKAGYCFSKEKYEAFMAYKEALLCENDKIFKKFLSRALIPNIFIMPTANI